MTIIGNIIESARKFSLHKSATLENPNNIKIFYECLNIHLSLSLGSIGLYWEQTSTSPKLIIFALIYFLIGIAFKASLSEHQPERISIRDSDSLCGFIIPNACAVSLMATLTLINIRVIGKDEIMTFIAILIIGMILGVCISLLFSSLLSCLIKNRLPVKEQIRIDSLDSIDKLLGQTKKRYLTNGELNKLKSEIMKIYFYMFAS